MRRLRVVFVAPFGVCRRGTTQARVIPLAAALAARNHDVSVIVPDWDCPAQAGQRYWVGGARVHHLSAPDAGRRLISPRLLCRTYQTVRASKADVVHCFKPIGYSGLIAQFIAHTRKRTGSMPLLAVDADDLEGSDGWGSYGGRPRWQGCALGWQEQATLRCADAVTAASAYLQDRIAAWRDSRPAPTYLPNGVDVRSRFRASAPTEPTSPPSLLLYTRFNEFSPSRGAAILSQILDRLPQIRAVVVGDGPALARQMFLDELARRGSAPRVDWRGMLAADALDGVLEADSVALWLFDDTKINAARSPVKFLELMAHGRAIVAEDIGEVPRLAGGAAALVSAGDQSEIVAVATRLLQSKTERNALGRRAQRAAAHLAWSTQAEELEYLYGQLYT